MRSIYFISVFSLGWNSLGDRWQWSSSILRECRFLLKHLFATVSAGSALAVRGTLSPPWCARAEEQTISSELVTIEKHSSENGRANDFSTDLWAWKRSLPTENLPSTVVDRGVQASTKNSSLPIAAAYTQTALDLYKATLSKCITKEYGMMKARGVLQRTMRCRKPVSLAILNWTHIWVAAGADLVDICARIFCKSSFCPIFAYPYAKVYHFIRVKSHRVRRAPLLPVESVRFPARNGEYTAQQAILSQRRTFLCCLSTLRHLSHLRSQKFTSCSFSGSFSERNTQWNRLTKRLTCP